MERKSLMEYLKGLSDVRKEKGKRHEQEVILVIIIMGLMMGCKKYGGGAAPQREISRLADQNREKLLEKMPLHRGKIPSLMTLIRTLEKINQEELCNSFNEWMSQFITTEAIAIDGKGWSNTPTFKKYSERNREQRTELCEFDFIFWTEK
jgi:hypothetical protein